MTITLEASGDPKALMRHRMPWRGKNPRSYDPSAKDKKDFLAMVKNNAPKKPLTGPIVMDVRFYMQRPKKHYRTGKFAGKLKDTAPLHHTNKKDLDNLVKFIGDSLNGVFYKDDSQICELHAYKKYDHNPRTVIRMDVK